MVVGMPLIGKDYLRTGHNGWMTLRIESQGQMPRGDRGGAAAARRPAGTGHEAVPATTGQQSGPRTPSTRASMERPTRPRSLANITIQVTTDGSYREYPTASILDFAYEALCHQCSLCRCRDQPGRAKTIDEEKKVLDELDDDGSFLAEQAL